MQQPQMPGFNASPEEWATYRLHQGVLDVEQQRQDRESRARAVHAGMALGALAGAAAASREARGVQTTPRFGPIGTFLQWFGPGLVILLIFRNLAAVTVGFTLSWLIECFLMTAEEYEGELARSFVAWFYANVAVALAGFFVPLAMGVAWQGCTTIAACLSFAMMFGILVVGNIRELLH